MHVSAPAADPGLFPSPAERLCWENDLTLLLAEAGQRVFAGPVAPPFEPEQFARELARFDFDATMDLPELLRWTVAQLERGLVHINHPRYLGLFNPGPSFPAQCADRIAGAFNPQLASATTSPAAVAIEAHVISAVARNAGLGPAAGGHFTSGGSEANFAALICALTRAHPDFAELGSRAFAGPPVFYVSQDCHLAWIKIAHQAGIGRRAVRMVATDGTGRMSIPALRAMLQADLAEGRVPVMLVATAGTTNAGMIDPLEACAECARAAGLWYHVDAAWGGGVIASPRHRTLLAGLEQADSTTIDAHKWFATPMGCGMFLAADATMLSRCFHVTASFMPSRAAGQDPYLTSVQWSRRFSGLRLFLSLGAVGWRGHAAHVEHSIALANLLAEEMTRRGWRLANTPLLGVACIEPPAGGAGVRDIVRHVVATGGAWLSVAVFEGRDVVRACVTHGQTQASDIQAVAALLDAARHEA